jgi:hypothetical protein
LTRMHASAKMQRTVTEMQTQAISIQLHTLIDTYAYAYSQQA